MKNENLINILISVAGIIGAFFSCWIVIKTEISVLQTKIENLHEKVILFDSVNQKNLEVIKELSHEIIRLKTIMEQQKDIKK